MKICGWWLRTSARLRPRGISFRSGLAAGFGIFLLVVGGVPPSAPGQQMSRVDRDLAKAMLGNVCSDVQGNYLDAKLNGLNWEALVHEAKANIDKAPTMGAAVAQIEGLLEHLNDSHTFFVSPRRINTVDYGWKFEVIGKRALVTEVTPNSDAEKKGMRPGDELLTIDGFTVDRASALKLKRAIYVLVPLSRLDVDLRDPAGKLLHLNLAGNIIGHPAVFGLGGSSLSSNEQRNEAEHLRNMARAKYRELGPELMILRIPAFFQIGWDVDRLFKKARAHKTLIVDLRGTPGGRLDSVNDYLAHVLIQDAKVGDSVGRDRTKPITIKRNRRSGFMGDLIVLVDSETASAAEIFARTVQLEERGTILGDHTAGYTLEARYFIHRYGVNPVYSYGASVTVAHPIMADGKSLEHVGVEPDRTFLPTDADLAAGRDPLLTYAAGLAGVKLSPEDAAKIFPRTSMAE